MRPREGVLGDYSFSRGSTSKALPLYRGVQQSKSLSHSADSPAGGQYHFPGARPQQTPSSFRLHGASSFAGGRRGGSTLSGAAARGLLPPSSVSNETSRLLKRSQSLTAMRSGLVGDGGGSISSATASGCFSALSGLGGSLGSSPSAPSECRLVARGKARMMLAMETEFDMACWVSLETGEVDGMDLPLVVEGGKPCSVNFVSSGGDIEGALVFEGFNDCIPFRICAQSAVGTSVSFAGAVATNYVGKLGCLHTTVTAPATGALGVNSTEVPAMPIGASGACGVSVELRLSTDNPARLLATVRRATPAEVEQSRKCAADDRAAQSLLDILQMNEYTGG